MNPPVEFYTRDPGEDVVIVRGRIVHGTAGQGPLVLEYANPYGFPERVVVHQDADAVTVIPDTAVRGAA